jgi:SAM-dependent methyltransferase
MKNRLLLRLKAKLRRMRPGGEADVYRAFLAGGNQPWTPGYEMHKTAQVTAAVNNASWDPYHLPKGHGWRLDERVVEFPWFMSRLPAGAMRLLDAGSTLNHVHVLGHPKLREKKVFISTLAPENWAAWQWGVSYVFEDMREACFRDGYFDAIACISTMEHVGLDNAMLYTSDDAKKETGGGYGSFLAELRRMLKPGGTLYLTMPFGMHVNHGWFQVFNAAMVDDVIQRFVPSTVIETIYQYLPEGWVVSTREAAKDAEYFDIHKKKTYDPDYAAASRAVVCLEMRT